MLPHSALSLVEAKILFTQSCAVYVCTCRYALQDALAELLLVPLSQGLSLSLEPDWQPASPRYSPVFTSHSTGVAALSKAVVTQTQDFML